MMEFSKIFWGSREDWLNSKDFLVKDVFDERFAVNFEKISVKERIALGEKVEEPTQFITGLFYSKAKKRKNSDQV